MKNIFEPFSAGYNVPMPLSKDQWLKIRVSAEDKKAFEKESEDEGLSLSSWIRTHLIAVVKKKREQAALVRRTKQEKRKP